MKNPVGFLKGITNSPKALLRIVIGLVVLALGIFLFTRNGSGHGFTGAAVIFSQGFGYLVSMAAFLAIAGIACWGALKVYQQKQDTKSASFWVLVVIAVVFIAIAVGKGCTDKANEGVTAPKGRPDSVAQMA